jgi:hypothetical protein
LNPDAHLLCRAPRWQPALLLAALGGTLWLVTWRLD